MLTEFALTNFRGFPNRMVWNLANPSNYGFNTYAVKDGVIKNGIVYGPNGSGKTNFSLALFDIENHLSAKGKKSDYYDNFIYAGNAGSTVDFEYTFKFGTTLLHYAYSKDARGILQREALKVDGKCVFEKKEQFFFIDTELFPMDENMQQSLAENANSVSIVNFLLTSYPLSRDHYLIQLQQFVGSMLWFRNLDVREFIGLETSVSSLDEFIISHGMLNEFASFLAETSDQHFNLQADPSNKQILCKINGVFIPFQLIASTGTRSLQLLYFWIKRMNKASFVFIDEFDAFYHFRLSFEVCKLLFNLDCQVFTTSHNTYLMTNDLLRPDCNFILNHNQIKPLTECTDKELRFGHNIEKLFRGNAFSV